MRMSSLLIGLIGLLAGATIAAPLTARAEDQTFKDWWVACDNVRVCTAMGFPPEEAGGVALRIRREAKGQAMPVIDVLMGAEQSQGVNGPLSLIVDGEEVTRTGAPAKAHDDFRVWTVPNDMAAELAAAIVRGSGLTLKAGARTIATVSLSGASAAQRWMDDRQKRLNNVSALVVRGPAPESAVPAPPPLPVVKRAAPVSQAGLPAKPSAAVRQLTAKMECDAGPQSKPTASRLAPGVILWALPCWMGAYNASSVMVLADDKGGSARLVDLGGSGDANDRAMATNVEYDAARQTLEGYAKGRGIGDCGTNQTWVWTGAAFAMVEQLEMSPCRELSGDFWVETYRSR